MEKRWYIVHAYSNFERKVAEAIKDRAKAAGLSDLFEEVLVPTEDVVEVRRGRKSAGGAQVLPRLRAGQDGHDGCGLSPDQEHAEGDGLPGVRQQGDADQRGRGQAHPLPGQGGRGAAEAHDHLRDRREGAGGRRSRSPPSRGRWRRSTRSARASRWACSSSAGRRRSSWSSGRSRRWCERRAIAGWVRPAGRSPTYPGG